MFIKFLGRPWVSSGSEVDKTLAVWELLVGKSDVNHPRDTQ